jgi:hypothetical protein
MLGIATLVIAVALSASCSPSTATLGPVVCDGVTKEAGGCTTERHEFTGTTCVDLGIEWGQLVDRQVVAIIDGPADVGGNAKSVRLKQAVVIASLDVNERMRELDLRSDCNVEMILSVGEPQFSEALRSGVGSAMYDGNPAVGYDDWMTDVRRSLQVIDDED